MRRVRASLAVLPAGGWVVDGSGRRVVVGRAVVTVTGALAVLGADWTVVVVVVVVVGFGAGVVVVAEAIAVVGSSS